MTKHYRTVTKTCACGKQFEVVNTVAHRAFRCPECRLEWDRHRDAETARKRREKGRVRFHKPRPTQKIYKMVVDPGDTWGNDTWMSISEIHDLINKTTPDLHWLEVGCKFLNTRTGCTFEIVERAEALKLEKIGG